MNKDLSYASATSDLRGRASTAFGFSGNVLTDGAVNTDACMRCDAATIEPYLQTLVN